MRMIGTGKLPSTQSSESWSKPHANGSIFFENCILGLEQYVIHYSDHDEANLLAVQLSAAIQVRINGVDARLAIGTQLKTAAPRAINKGK